MTQLITHDELLELGFDTDDYYFYHKDNCNIDYWGGKWVHTMLRYPNGMKREFAGTMFVYDTSKEIDKLTTILEGNQ